MTKSEIRISKFEVILYLVFSLLFLARPGVGYAQVTVTAHVDKQQATLEDEIELIVRVEGSRRATEPVLPSLPAFRVVPTGSSSSIQIINGDVSLHKEYSYVLIPQEEGTHTIGSVSVFADGREYQSRPITIAIGRSAAAPPPPPFATEPPSREPAPPLPTPLPEPDRGGESLKPYGITTEVSSQNPFAGEQIIYTFRFYTSVNVGTAALTLPDFKDFWSEEIVPEKKQDQTIGGRRYIVSEKKFALFPLRSGDFKVGETTLEVEVPDESRRSFFDDPFFSFGRVPMRNKTLRAPPISITVKPLPEPAPSDFSGLVGEFEMKTDLNPAEIKMGESATLDIRVSGQGNIKDAVLPPLRGWEAFKVYEDKPQTETVRKEGGIEGKKTFKIALVPVQAGDLSLPSIGLSYFDPKKGAYELLESGVKSVRVLPSESEPLHAAGAKPGAEGFAPLKLEPEDIATLHTRLTLSNEIPFLERRAIGYFLIGLPFFVFLGSGLFRLRRKKLESNRPQIRSHRAFRELVKKLGRLEKGSEARQLIEAVRGYAGDRLGLFGSALTGAEIEGLLSSRRVSREWAEGVSALLGQWEGFVYGRRAPSGGWEEEARKAKELLRKIDGAIKDKR